MEPNKLEREFKEKLEERTIQPSVMAWDRLDAMLSVTEEKKQPKRKYWLYIAAGFLGFLLVAALLLKLEGSTIPAGDANAVVNTSGPETGKINPVTSPVHNAAEDVISQPLATKALAVQEEVTAKPVKAHDKGRAANVVVQDNGSIPAIVKNEAVAVQQVYNTPEQESEMLLASSLAEEPAPKKKSAFKVDANSLLSSVEGELNNNFRNEVLQKVVKNYNTVKTSVANRNFE